MWTFPTLSLIIERTKWGQVARICKKQNFNKYLCQSLLLFPFRRLTSIPCPSDTRSSAGHSMAIAVAAGAARCIVPGAIRCGVFVYALFMEDWFPAHSTCWLLHLTLAKSSCILKQLYCFIMQDLFAALLYAEFSQLEPHTAWVCRSSTHSKCVFSGLFNSLVFTSISKVGRTFCTDLPIDCAKSNPSQKTISPSFEIFSKLLKIVAAEGWVPTPNCWWN